MKKFLSIALIFSMIISLAILTGCGEKNPYEELTLSEYVTLPDYSGYTTKEVKVSISDEDVQTEIESRLEAAATTKEVKKGTVEKGDTVNIAYKGTLEDGSTQDGMNSDSFDLTLGEASMIDGFQEGIYGATIGKPVTLNLEFPDPYTVNEDLSGKKVTFVVTVNSKKVKVPAELNEDFVKANSDVKTVEDYKKYVAEDLKKTKKDQELSNLKTEIWNKIFDETEVIKYPEDLLSEEIKQYDENIRASIANQGMDFDEYLSETLKFTEEEYNEQIKSDSQIVVKQKMVIYSLAEKEGVKVTDKEYKETLDSLLKSSGMEDEEAFEKQVGISLEEYAEAYGVRQNMLLDKALTSIYEKLEKK